MFDQTFLKFEEKGYYDYDERRISIDDKPA